MKKYICIGAFGFFGAMARFAVKQLSFPAYFQPFPVATLVINIVGSFLFSLIVTIAFETGKISHNLRLGITAGFLGAFTTFSTFCRDAASLLQGGHAVTALVYAAASLVCGLLAAAGGAVIVKAVVLKDIKKLGPTAGAPADGITGESEN